MANKAFNLPNTLAWLRIAAAPLLFFLLVERAPFLAMGVHPGWLDYAAILVFSFAAITDFFDGYIARAWNQTTVLGEILDPLADKLLVLAAFLGLMLLDRANAWAVLIILGREFFITGLRVMIVAEGKSVAASNWGKWKTGFQITAIVFMILNWWPIVSITLLWIAVALTLWSGYEYVRDYARPKAA
ncbi:MAG: CDP-diacylglycerol--glycerol-3-phosphate 3-phosphatidyltransferase [Campylobacterales bacterium]